MIKTMKTVKDVLSQHILADGFPLVMDLKRSHHSYIVDEETGQEYLDMFSMFASGAIGYNHPKLLLHRERLAEVALIKPTLSDVYCRAYADFVETFARIAMPPELPHAFFIEGGAVAVENAIKVAFDWKRRHNMERQRDQPGEKVLHFKNAFHGRTGYTLSLTNTSDPRKTMYFPKFDWPRIDTPRQRFPMTEENLRLVQREEIHAIEQILQAVQKYKHNIAALIVETIQGEGGDNHFRAEFFQELRKVCDEHEIFFILDEVQAGVGITGKMWAYQHFGIEPDAIAFGKKTQVCGMLVGKRVEEVKGHCFEEASRLNSTFGGNLTDMVRFQIILEIIQEDKLIENAAKQGKYLLQGLQGLEKTFPKTVTNARGRGLFCAFDCSTQELRKKLIAKMYENNLILLPCGETSIRFRPHLTVTPGEIDHAMDICQRSLKAIL